MEGQVPACFTGICAMVIQIYIFGGTVDQSSSAIIPTLKVNSTSELSKMSSNKLKTLLLKL